MYNITVDLNVIAFWGGLGFQNLVGTTYRQLERLHDAIMVWLLVILILVGFISRKVLKRFKRRLFIDSELLEKTWTLIPMLILITIAFPRLHLLCVQDALCQSPVSSIKVVSNQWNWQREAESYEQNDHLLDPDEVDNLGAFEVPIALVSLGVNRMVITSSDVLHSLGFPRLGLKLDSIPGRLNVTTVEIMSPGLFVGSCFELCGSGHSAIPINALVI